MAIRSWRQVVVAAGLANVLSQQTYAQSASIPSICSNSATTHLVKSADATSIGAACPTYYGSIALGDSGSEDIHLDGVKTIMGDLSLARDTDGTTFTTSDSINVTGDFVAASAAKTNFISVGNIGGDLFDALCFWGTDYLGPGQASPVSVGRGVSVSGGNRRAAYFNFTAGEALTTSPFLTYNMTQLVSIDIVGNFAGFIWVYNNPFPTLSLANSIASIAKLDASNISSLTADGLLSVNGHFNLTGSSITTLHLPQVALISGDLKLQDNAIQAIDLPALGSINGDLVLANNSVTNATGFSKLSSVYGSITLNGNFEDVYFPQLTSVQGDMSITSGNDMSCSNIASRYVASSGRIINGTFTCSSANDSLKVAKGQTVPGSGNVAPTSSSGNSSNGTAAASTSKSNTTAIGAGVGVGVGVTAILLGALVWFCLKKRKAKRLRCDDTSAHSKSDLTSDTHDHGQYELADNDAVVPGRYEMLDKSSHAHELHASHGAVEAMDERADKSAYERNASRPAHKEMEKGTPGSTYQAIPVELP